MKLQHWGFKMPDQQRGLSDNANARKMVRAAGVSLSLCLMLEMAAL